MACAGEARRARGCVFRVDAREGEVLEVEEASDDVYHAVDLDALHDEGRVLLGLGGRAFV